MDNGFQRRTVPKSELLRRVLAGELQTSDLSGAEITPTELQAKFDHYEVNERGEPYERKKNQGLPRMKIFAGKDQEFVIAQLEHFGDSIVNFSARLLAYEVHGTDWRSYILLCNSLIRNSNFQTHPEFERDPNGFEVVVGQEYALEGFEVALDTAKDMLRKTEAYRRVVPEQ